MNKQFDQLRALTKEQRKLIVKLLSDNYRLNCQAKSLRKRVQDLERLQLVVDREIIEIPISLELIPEDDLNKF